MVSSDKKSVFENVMTNRKKKGDTMAFVYNEETQCFSKELNDILFSCEVLDSILEITANRLAKIYESKLPLIAEYIVSNNEFLKVYGEMSKEELLESFKKMTIPWIFLKDNNSGTIAYADSDYVIEFSFIGDFERFSDLSIDS